MTSTCCAKENVVSFLSDIITQTYQSALQKTHETSALSSLESPEFVCDSGPMPLPTCTVTLILLQQLHNQELWSSL